ncbi:protein of unknown function (plasmid) [Rhodovastum atsumiense]|nr:protein of unknown function [Rhodovastum atsumiense]
MAPVVDDPGPPNTGPISRSRPLLADYEQILPTDDCQSKGGGRPWGVYAVPRLYDGGTTPGEITQATALSLRQAPMHLCWRRLRRMARRAMMVSRSMWSSLSESG